MAEKSTDIKISRKPTLVFWRTFIIFFCLIEAAFIFLLIRSYDIHMRNRVQWLHAQSTAVVDNLADRMEHNLTGAVDDVRFIAGSPVVQGYFANATSRNFGHLESFIRAFMNSHNPYIHAQFLDPEGMEILHVSRDGRTGSLNVSRKSAAPPAARYFKSFPGMSPGQSFLSPVLNNPGSELDIHPVIYAAQAVLNRDDRYQGAVVLTIDAESILSRFSTQISASEYGTPPLEPVFFRRDGTPILGPIRDLSDIWKHISIHPADHIAFGGGYITYRRIEIPRSKIVSLDAGLEPVQPAPSSSATPGPYVGTFLPETEFNAFVQAYDRVYIQTGLALTLLNILIAFFLGAFQDRQSKYGEQMRREKERFQSLYNGVSDSVMVCQMKPGNHLGRFIEVNEVACRRLGYSVEEFSRMTLRDVTAADCNPDIWREFVDSGEPFEQKRLNKAGQELWVETRVRRLRYGATPALMLLEHDVTNLHATVEQLKQAKVLAESANRSKSAFLANMSHEIRTPMNAILGYTQLLRRDRSLNVTAREHLEIIHRSGEHLLALINDILELSKVEAGRVNVSEELFDMERMMKDLERMFQLRIKQKGLCFAVESSWDLDGSILADQGKVRQIMINMLGNAVKFTENGGIIVRYGVIRSAVLAGKVRIWVEVEDTGRGIAAEEIGKVFRPFEQAESGVSEGGTGLGMAISREYARIMGGDITVVSKPGRGSTFRLEFLAEPSTEEQEDALDHTTIIRLVIDREYTIMVVDDRENNRRLLRTLLENNGFSVVTANDGMEAVEMFKGETPNLVIMDLKMPLMNGCEATRLIRSLPGGSTVPVILVTASTTGSDIPDGSDALFHTIIRKPFKDTEVLSAIRDALRLDYRYEYEPKVPTSIFSTTQMRVSSRIIPLETRLEMNRAVRNGDMDRFEVLTDALAQEHPLMAARLRQYAEAFDYDKLLLILEDQETEV